MGLLTARQRERQAYATLVAAEREAERADSFLRCARSAHAQAYAALQREELADDIRGRTRR